MEQLKNAINTFFYSEEYYEIRMLLIALLVLFLVLFLIKKTIVKVVDDTQNSYRIRKATNVFGYVLFVAIVLFIYEDNLGSVGVTLGIAGAGITFALQGVIVSIAGWLDIMITGQIKTGQRIKIGNIKGDIIDIGLLKTVIMETGDWINGDLYNGRITSISNSFVFNEPIQNYSSDFPFLWDELTIPLRTESDFQLARKLIEEIAKEVCQDYANKSKATWEKMKTKFLIVDATVEPTLSMKFDENWITFTLRYIVDYRRRRSTKDVLYTRILEEINNHKDKLEIATAAMEITAILKK